ncbi:hypothetical protein [Frigoribacterium sp. Leaf172]|uniref:hypothetical protein n=1 Tax=Frigoribacterium sp. Leaf172 TaxID=1736285 RepID=UPI0006FB4BA3|nr:hypothetical protein [Frigoribacterium sp. Leaf172]KQR64429.1 hypothetical protein ASF89_07835 [Frigoribacterium sp. Leaf172]
MSVDASHPSCFVLDRRLFAMPSGASRSLSQTKSDLRDLDARSETGRTHLDVWSIVGAITGGFFLAVVAGGVWGVTSLLSLLLCFGMGATVGALLAVGTRALFIAPTTAGRADPQTCEAVEIPWDVADAAPDDATGDELILWATLVVRYRLAEEARAGRTGPEVASATDHDYEAALRDYESVASLLGLSRDPH